MSMSYIYIYQFFYSSSPRHRKSFRVYDSTASFNFLWFLAFYLGSGLFTSFMCMLWVCNALGSWIPLMSISCNSFCHASLVSMAGVLSPTSLNVAQLSPYSPLSEELWRLPEMKLPTILTAIYIPRTSTLTPSSCTRYQFFNQQIASRMVPQVTRVALDHSLLYSFGTSVATLSCQRTFVPLFAILITDQSGQGKWMQKLLVRNATYFHYFIPWMCRLQLSKDWGVQEAQQTLKLTNHFHEILCHRRNKRILGGIFLRRKLTLWDAVYKTYLQDEISTGNTRTSANPLPEISYTVPPRIFWQPIRNCSRIFLAYRLLDHLSICSLNFSGSFGFISTSVDITFVDFTKYCLNKIMVYRCGKASLLHRFTVNIKYPMLIH